MTGVNHCKKKLKLYVSELNQEHLCFHTHTHCHPLAGPQKHSVSIEVLHASLWNFKQEFLLFITGTPLFASQACQCLLRASRRVVRKINFNARPNRFSMSFQPVFVVVGVGGGLVNPIVATWIASGLCWTRHLDSGGWLNHRMTTHMSDRWESQSLPSCWNILLLFDTSLALNFKSLQVWFWGLHSVPSHSLSSVILAALIIWKTPHQNQLQTRPLVWYTQIYLGFQCIEGGLLSLVLLSP